MATRATSGNDFGGSVYRNPYGIVVNRSALTAAIVLGFFVTPATVATGLAAGGGMVRMGAGDGLELIFTGTTTNNQTINYNVSGLMPCFASTAGDTTDPVGYIQVPRATGVATLGATTVGAAANGILGMLTADLRADTITNTLSLGGVTLYSPADDTTAHIRIDALQNEILWVQTDLGTADGVAHVIGRRIQGGAQNMPRLG